MAEVDFNVHSAVRPWAGTFGDVDRAARSLRRIAARPGRRSRRRRGGPAAELGRGRHHVLGRRSTWVRSWCRSSTSTGAKEVDYILSVTSSRGGGRRPRASGTPTTSSLYGELAVRHQVPNWLVVGDEPSLGACRAPRSASRTCSTRRRSEGPSTDRPRSTRSEPALIGFTSGTTSDPKGVVHSHDTLGFEAPPARLDVPRRRPRADHRRAGRPLHRHAQRVPRAAAPLASGEPRRRLGPRRGPAPDARARARHDRRVDLLPHQPARPSGLHRGAPAPHAVRRAGRVAGARWRSPSGTRPRHQGVPLVRQHRAPVDHRVHHRRTRGQAAAHRRPRPAGGRDTPRRRRSDPEPWPGPASSATPTRS